MKILLVRNDKIGDFMLAWPAIAQLKLSMPHAQITVLVPSYTAPLAKLNPHIDNVIIDPGADADKAQQKKLLTKIKSSHFEAMLTLFSTTRVAWLGRRAGIPYRLAPATKFAQFLYTDRLTQRRSRSEKPESEYNKDLIKHFLTHHHIAVKEVSTPYLQFDKATLKSVTGTLLSDTKLEHHPEHKIVMIHTGSGGSANNLSTEQYINLLVELARLQPYWYFVLTAGPGEHDATNAVANGLKQANVVCHTYYSTAGLEIFCQVIACADLFIAGSTGPLHIAGALNVPTAGFYPRKRSATPLRWQTMSEQRLAFTPPEGGAQDDMSLIDAKASANIIAENM